jgi:hypothetical protein
MHVNSISGSDLSLADGRPARQNTSLRNGTEQQRETGMANGVWDGGNGSDAQECELMKAQAVMGAFSLPEMTRDDPRRPSAQNRKRSVILFCGLHVMDLIWPSLSGTEGVGEAFGAGSRLGRMCGWRSSRSEAAWTPSAGRPPAPRSGHLLFSQIQDCPFLERVVLTFRRLFDDLLLPLKITAVGPRSLNSRCIAAKLSLKHIQLSECDSEVSIIINPTIDVPSKHGGQKRHGYRFLFFFPPFLNSHRVRA